MFKEALIWATWPHFPAASVKTESQVPFVSTVVVLVTFLVLVLKSLSSTKMITASAVLTAELAVPAQLVIPCPSVSATADHLFARLTTIPLELVMTITPITTTITATITRIRIPIVTIEEIMLARSTMPEILVSLVHTSPPLLVGTIALTLTQRLHVVPRPQSSVLIHRVAHLLVAMAVMIFAEKVAFVVRNMVMQPMAEARSSLPVTLHAARTTDAVITVVMNTAMATVAATADEMKFQSGMTSVVKNSAARSR